MKKVEGHLVSNGHARLYQRAMEGFSGLPRVRFDREALAEVPLLLLQARFDLKTVLGYGEHVSAHHGQPLYVFDDGGHAVSFGSSGNLADGTPCARDLVAQFMADPGGPIDDSCIDAMPTIDPNLRRPDLQELNLQAFGVADPWSLLPTN